MSAGFSGCLDCLGYTATAGGGCPVCVRDRVVRGYEAAYQVGGARRHDVRALWSAVQGTLLYLSLRGAWSS